MEGWVANIQRFCIHDGPGIRTTVFVKGCPLRCKWCDNPETWRQGPDLMFVARLCEGCGKCLAVCPEAAIDFDKPERIDREKCTLCMQCVRVCKYGALKKVGERMTAEEVVEEVERDRVFYKTSNGGVTISGGEPLEQAELVSEILRLCKAKGISTVIDTSGFGSQEALDKILPYADMVLLDIKHMDPVKHKEWTGVSNEVILKNAKRLAANTEVRISLPIVKGFNDYEENLRATAEFAKSLGIRAIDVEPLHKLAEQKYRFLGLRSPYQDLEKLTDEEVERIREFFHSCGLETTKGRSF